MPDAGFHFAAPLWLLALLLPLPVFVWLLLTAPRQDSSRYRAYADEHLLPLLLGTQRRQRRFSWRAWFGWTSLWSLLVLGMAGPRWDYHDIQLFRPGSDLLILLDMSKSMDVGDVLPSRMMRARQEIEDLINQNRQARIGLIAFASMAHIVAPLTEDGASVRMQLPALTTDLFKLTGSRLDQALIRAQLMLAGQPEDSSRHVLLISDGDFGDQDVTAHVNALTELGVHLHVLGVGTASGGPVIDAKGRSLQQADGRPVVSRLEEARLAGLAKQGNGTYRTAGYRDDDTRAILQQVMRDATAEVVVDQKTRVWNERFYWLVALVMLLLLPRFRRLRPAAVNGGRE